MFNWLRRRPKDPRDLLPTRVVFDADTIRAFADDREIESVRWTALECVHAYKQDCFGMDRIWVAFDAADMPEPLCIHEEAEGYHALIEEMQRRCPGYRPDWLSAVMFPAFARNHTTIWRKDPAAPTGT